MEDFPPTHQALEEPNGLLAIGGDLTPERLLLAYSRGVFPWYGAQDPILWWSPNPRCTLLPAEFKISKTLRKTLKNNVFKLTFDHSFAAVMRACAEPRRDSAETWIGPDMLSAYGRLHDLGYAHSIEAWQGEILVGGLYGIQMGQCFFGESMFSRESEASKVALAGLIWLARRHALTLIDCQVSSDHLLSLGAKNLSRQDFENLLATAIKGSGMGDLDRRFGAGAENFPSTSNMLSHLQTEGGKL